MCILAGITNLLAACSAPREDPLSERHVPGLFTRSTAEIGVISTGAAHRVVTFRVKPTSVNEQLAGAFCAEPPPDAAEAIASRLATALDTRVPAAIGAGVSNVEVRTNYERALQTAVMALGRRSQGLQFARDERAAACQDYLNGRIDGPEYRRRLHEAKWLGYDLIRREIRYLPSQAGGQSVTAPALPALPPTR
jgi:hypothetical protein